MTTVLSRGDGSSQTWQNTELITVLNNLETANNTHTETNGIAYVRVSAGRLLILDVNTLWGRKLLEIFGIGYDSTNPFGLKFTANNIDYDIDGALTAVGYSNFVFVSALSAINAATYYQPDQDKYLSVTNLVADQGSFGVAPGQLKILAVDLPLTLTDNGAGTVTLGGGAATPTYGISIYDGTNHNISLS